MKIRLKIRDITATTEDGKIKFVPIDGEYESDGTKESIAAAAVEALDDIAATRGVFRVTDEYGIETGQQIECAGGAYIYQEDIFNHNIDTEEDKEATAERVCPECGKTYSAPPALSRLDNETAVCSECGTNEAMFDFKFKMWNKADQYGQNS